MEQEPGFLSTKQTPGKRVLCSAWPWIPTPVCDAALRGQLCGLELFKVAMSTESSSGLALFLHPRGRVSEWARLGHRAPAADPSRNCPSPSERSGRKLPQRKRVQPSAASRSPQFGVLCSCLATRGAAFSWQLDSEFNPWGHFGECQGPLLPSL